MISSDQLETGARHILGALRRAGYETYWAGGYVRDRLLGRPAKDIDVVTAAQPDEIQALFPKTFEVGKSFGVIVVLHEGHPYEVSTFRRDREYRDGRRPESVEFCAPEEDARRRDFTINALFYDPETDRVIDHVNGLADLNARMIRAIGDPEERFREDHLRLLRAIRFASVLNFRIEPATFDAVRKHAELIRHVSAERIRQELTRLLVESPRAGDGLCLLRDSGLLSILLPGVAAMEGQEQPPQFHPEGDVFTHTVLMLNAMENPSTKLAYAVLLHDVGKPTTASVGPGRDGRNRIRFDRHDEVGAAMAEDILRRLRFPNEDIEAITAVIRNHMRFMHVQEMRPATLKRMIGADWFPIELELHRLDCLASHGMLDNYEFLRDYVDHLRNEPVLPPPLISGHDVMALGIPEGREVGRWVKAAYTYQLEHEGVDRETLLTWLRERMREAGNPPPASPGS